MLPGKKKTPVRSYAEAWALVIEHDNLVWRVCHRMFPLGNFCENLRRIGGMEDAHAAGREGLLHACLHWDGQRPLSTYAYRCIRSRLMVALDNGGIIRTPVRNRGKRALSYPDDFNRARAVLGLHAPAESNTDSFAVTRPDPNQPNPAHIAERRDLFDRVMEAVRLLPKAHQRVLLAVVMDDRTLRELAAEDNQVGSAAGHRLKYALRVLRDQFREIA